MSGILKAVNLVRKLAVNSVDEAGNSKIYISAEQLKDFMSQIIEVQVKKEHPRKMA